MRFLTILLLASACGGGAAKSPTTAAMPPLAEPADPIPATGGPECAVVADKVAPVARAELPDEQEALRTALHARCTEDVWSDEARSCFATIENDAELDGCMTKLTTKQRTAAAAALGREGEADAEDKTGATPGGKTSPPPPGNTRGAAQRKSSDPEEGGESR